MKTIAALFTAAALTAGSAAHAEATAPRTEAKMAGTFLTSALVGAVAGGPIGLFAGALGGAWMGEQIREADSVGPLQEQLALREGEMGELAARLREATESQQRYAQLALDQLQLEMLFRTGESAISRSGEARLAMLAELLRLNPDLSVRLDGYADPRGGADYNRQLSAQRVQAVIETLSEFGIDPARLAGFSHGADQSRAAEGDYDAYALERVVRITLLTDEGQKALAQAQIR